MVKNQTKPKISVRLALVCLLIGLILVRFSPEWFGLVCFDLKKKLKKTELNQTMLKPRWQTTHVQRYQWAFSSCWPVGGSLSQKKRTEVKKIAAWPAHNKLPMKPKYPG